MIQAACERLAGMTGIVWAGATEAELVPRWVAFAGSDSHAPLEPESDQVFRQVQSEDPAGSVIVEIHPARRGRAYSCGILFPSGLTLVAVPDPDSPAPPVVIANALRDALRALRQALPRGPLPPGGGPPGQPPPGTTPSHAWAWVSLPPSPRKPR